MAVKKEPTTGLKEIKKDLLKVINKLSIAEQNIINLSIKVKRLEQRVGIPR